jgi:hypothetical protein
VGGVVEPSLVAVEAVEDIHITHQFLSPFHRIQFKLVLEEEVKVNT